MALSFLHKVSSNEYWHVISLFPLTESLLPNKGSKRSVWITAKKNYTKKSARPRDLVAVWNDTNILAGQSASEPTCATCAHARASSRHGIPPPKYWQPHLPVLHGGFPVFSALFFLLYSRPTTIQRSTFQKKKNDTTFYFFFFYKSSIVLTTPIGNVCSFLS
jgi:predicted cupin superfamily sugar epimerase